jgi:hypothetical protein
MQQQQQQQSLKKTTNAAGKTFYVPKYQFVESANAAYGTAMNFREGRNKTSNY